MALAEAQVLEKGRDVPLSIVLSRMAGIVPVSASALSALERGVGAPCGAKSSTVSRSRVLIG